MERRLHLRSSKPVLLALVLAALSLGGCRYVCPPALTGADVADDGSMQTEAEEPTNDAVEPQRTAGTDPVRTPVQPDGEVRGPSANPLEEGKRLLSEGDYRGADRAFAAANERSEAATEAHEALFLRGLIRMIPESSIYDPASAQGLLELLTSSAPSSPWAAQAGAVLRLQRELEQTRERLEQLRQIDLGEN